MGRELRMTVNEGEMGAGVEKSLSLGNCNQIQTSSGLFILWKPLRTPENLCAFVSVGCPVLTLTVEGIKPKLEMSMRTPVQIPRTEVKARHGRVVPGGSCNPRVSAAR